MSVYPKQKTTELVGLACLMCALLLILALYSYSPLDGSLNVSSVGTGYLNYIGRTGAWLSDFLLQLFGLAAFVIPLVLLSAGFRQLRGRSVEYPIVKTCGTVGILAAGAAGLSILQPTLVLATQYEPGGIVGILVASLLEAALNPAGALICGLLWTVVRTGHHHPLLFRGRDRLAQPAELESHRQFPGELCRLAEKAPGPAGP